MGFSVVGGQLQAKALKTQLGERVFDIGKAHVWLGMIQKYQRPTKWGKANKQGTKISFDMIRTKEDVEKAFDELEMYIRSVNRKHGTDITLERPKGSDSSEILNEVEAEG